ncbi:MAG: hypothetical protein LDL33_15920 [Desulfomonile sp.]|nr:hypothetical protein [Desulfomonile sp.]
MPQDTGVSLRDTLNALFRRIYILVILVILLPIGTLVGTYWVSPVYESGGKVLIRGKEQSPNVVKVPQAGFSPMVNLDVDESDLNSEMELLLSLDLWTQTVNKLGLPYFEQTERWSPLSPLVDLKDMIKETLGLTDPSQTKAVKEAEKVQQTAIAMRKRCKVDPLPKSRVLDITFRYDDPVKTRHILTTLLDIYIPYRTKIYSVRGAIGFFGKEVDTHRAAYDKALADLMAFKKKWEIFIPEKQIEEEIGLVRQIDDTLIKLDADIKQVENMLKELDRNTIPTGQLASFQNPVISVMAAQLLRASERNLQVCQNFGEGTRDYEESKALVNDLTTKFRDALRGELANMISKREVMETSRKEKLARLTLIEQRTQEAGQLELAVAVAKERYLKYLSKVEDVRIDELVEAGHVHNVRIVSQPYLPARPIFPQRGLMVAGAFVFAFPLGIGLIMMANLFDRTFNTPQEVENATGFQVLASLKRLPADGGPEQDRA